MKFKNLFSPIKISNLKIKNRVVMPPMVRNYATSNGTVTPRYETHIESIASGGTGMLILEASFISPEGKGFINELGIDNDKKIEGLKKLVKIAHKHNAVIGPQLYHAGRQTHHSITKTKPVSPSPIPCPIMQDKPHKLTLEEIYELENKYTDSALRAKDAGFDFIEIHGAHGYLITQFLSPFSNHRKDKYGGSFENRFRFIKNIVLKTKAVLGDEFPIIVRLSVDELVPKGLKIEDSIIIAKELEKIGVHAIHITQSNYASYAQGMLIPPMAIEDAPFESNTNQIKKAVNIPVIAVGKIHKPELAEKILSNNKADMIAIGRALLADPNWPNKAQKDNIDNINMCISCNQGCISRLFAQQDVHCIANPLCGFEKELTLPIKTKKTQKIAILGGGPAGLYCAKELSRIGHKVVLFEQSKKLGGQLNLAYKPPFRTNINILKNFLIDQAKKNKVEIQLNTTLTPKEFEKKKFDILINNTGSTAFKPNFPGANLKKVIMAEDVLNDSVKLKKKVLVAGGGCQGVQVADMLAQKNHNVTIIELSDTVAKVMPTSERYLLLQRLEKKRSKIHTNTKIIKIDSKGVIIEKGKGKTKLMTDNVVICFGRIPNIEHLQDFKKITKNIYNIGDSHQIGRIEDAIRSAAEVCKKIS